MEIDRRQVLLTGAAAILLSLTGSPSARAAARKQTLVINSTAIPVKKAAAPWDFDLFYDLSRYITARSVLDRKVAHLHFEQFRQEEWGWANAGRLYSIIRKALDAGVASAPELLTSGKLSKLDQWFAQHILDAWYDGFYRYDGAERRVTFAGALMWELVSDVVPVQGLSDAEYGFWGKRPERGD